MDRFWNEDPIPELTLLVPVSPSSSMEPLQFGFILDPSSIVEGVENLSGTDAPVSLGNDQQNVASTFALPVPLSNPQPKGKKRKRSGQLSCQQCSDDEMSGDDEINDAAVMGGVNLAEETRNVLDSRTIDTQSGSCKDELVSLHAMQARVKAIASSHGLEDSSPEVSRLLIQALHEYLKTYVEKLAVVAEHRTDQSMKNDSRYEVTQDVKGQLQFLEELDLTQKKRQENLEREILLRAVKSRSKNKEQAKQKAKGKELLREELKRRHLCKANSTALQAIGQRKKPRLDEAGISGDFTPSTSAPSTSGLGRGNQPARCTNIKRVNMTDLMFILKNDVSTAHSTLQDVRYKYCLQESSRRTNSKSN